MLAGILETDIDTLMGYIPKKKMVTPYEDRYNAKEYYWGTMPNEMCMEVLRRYYPTRPVSYTHLDVYKRQPHMAWASVEARTRVVTETCKNIEAFRRGEPRNVLNP